MPRIHLLSDLHMEGCNFQPSIDPNLFDILVLLGDINKADNGIVWARETYPDKEIIYVPGNHEYYGYDYMQCRQIMYDKAKKYNVHLLDGDYITLMGIQFFGATLWSNFNLYSPIPYVKDEKSIYQMEGMRYALMYINDYRWTKNGNHFITPEHHLMLHNLSIERMMDWQQQRQNMPSVVLTHFLPHPKSISVKYAGTPLNAYFCSNLDTIIRDMQPDYWFHGHTHDSCDYIVHNTRVVCNPRGYARGNINENRSFDPNLVIDIPIN